jgi:16S rRNA processing protein RimM
VKGARGSVFYPFTKAVVPVVDVAAGRVIVVPPAETEAREE